MNRDRRIVARGPLSVVRVVPEPPEVGPRITDNGPRSQGFTLLEIMLVVMLLSVAMASATWVFRSSLLMLHQSERSAGAVGRLTTAVEMMRRDVAGARTIEAGGHDITVRSVDGRTIRWQCGKGTWRREAAGEPARRWTGLPEAAMTQEKAGVMVEWPDAPLHAGGRAWMEVASWRR